MFKIIVPYELKLMAQAVFEPSRIANARAERQSARTTYPWLKPESIVHFKVDKPIDHLATVVSVEKSTKCINSTN